jgi:Fusaric acid resistance protein-like
VAFGDWAAQVPWAGVLAICAVAVLATFVCNALAVVPPGAYMFVLACAAGTGLATEHLAPWRVGLLVLAGGTLAWLVHMAGAVFGFRRPERLSVAAAAAATEAYVEAVGTDGESPARHRAAQALHESWKILVNFQPAHRVSGPELTALRAETLRLHVRFAEAMNGVSGGSAPAVPDRVDPDRLPLGRPRAVDLLRRAATPGSPAARIALRVGVAAVIAGFVALWLGVDHSYWAVASAVLMLYQGFDWIRTLERGAERMLGTFVGLLLAGLVLEVAPHGLLLALLLGVLQFVVEMSVTRNYALAVVFITPMALTIAYSGSPVHDVPSLLAARGIDTLIGCLTALLVYLIAVRRHNVARLDGAVAATLRAVTTTAPYVASRQVGSSGARAARRDLQLCLMAMVAAYDTGVGGSERERRSAERMWPTVVAAEDLGYRVLAACWAIEHGQAATDLAPGGLGAFTGTVDELAEAVESSSTPALGELPDFAGAEINRLQKSLVCKED